MGIGLGFNAFIFTGIIILGTPTSFVVLNCNLRPKQFIIIFFTSFNFIFFQWLFFRVDIFL